MKKQLVAIALLFLSSLHAHATGFVFENQNSTITFGKAGGPTDVLTFSHSFYPNIVPPQVQNPPSWFWSASYSITLIQADGSVNVQSLTDFSNESSSGIFRPFTYPNFFVLGSSTPTLSLDGIVALNISVFSTFLPPSITQNQPYHFTLGIGVPDSVSAIDTTPIPAAFPLFATGLGALGLLTWRRKRC